MKRLLVLDVDGVLNRCGKSNQGLETDRCALLERIIRETGAGIVVSSTWRLYPSSLRRLDRLFADIGAKRVGVTPDLTASIDASVLLAAVPRHLEIRQWISENQFEGRYVILDDDTSADDGSGNYVRTNSYVGLTDEIADEVIRRLS